MKKLIVALSAMILGSGLLSAQNLPDVSVEDIDGRSVSIKEVVVGKPAVISFWGVTCKPCITELNALNEVMEECSKLREKSTQFELQLRVKGSGVMIMV